MTSGQVTFVTEPINGVLEGIFVSSQRNIQLRVTMGTSDIEVLNIQSIEGEHFIPIRLGVVDMLGVSFPHVADKIPLNDALKFEIKGARNTEATFKVRYC